MLLIYKEHASHLHSVLDKSGLRVSIDTQLWMPFIFVPALSLLILFLRSGKHHGTDQYICQVYFFPEMTITTHEANVFP